MVWCLNSWLLREKLEVPAHLSLWTHKSNGRCLKQNDRVIDVVLKVIVVLTVCMLLVCRLTLSILIWHRIRYSSPLRPDFWKRVHSFILYPSIPRILAALHLIVQNLLVFKIVSEIILRLEDFVVTFLQLLVMIFNKLSSILSLIFWCSEFWFALSTILIIFYWRVRISLIFEILLTVIVASWLSDELLQISWWVLIDIELGLALVAGSLQSVGPLVLLSLNHPSTWREFSSTILQSFVEEF
jgi:hypothetical protein